MSKSIGRRLALKKSSNVHTGLKLYFGNENKSAIRPSENVIASKRAKEESVTFRTELEKHEVERTLVLEPDPPWMNESLVVGPLPSGENLLSEQVPESSENLTSSESEVLPPLPAPNLAYYTRRPFVWTPDDTGVRRNDRTTPTCLLSKSEAESVNQSVINLTEDDENDDFDAFIENIDLCVIEQYEDSADQENQSSSSSAHHCSSTEKRESSAAVEISNVEHPVEEVSGLDSCPVCEMKFSLRTSGDKVDKHIQECLSGVICLD